MECKQDKFIKLAKEIYAKKKSKGFTWNECQKEAAYIVKKGRKPKRSFEKRAKYESIMMKKHREGLTAEETRYYKKHPEKKTEFFKRYPELKKSFAEDKERKKAKMLKKTERSLQKSPVMVRRRRTN